MVARLAVVRSTNRCALATLVAFLLVVACREVRAQDCGDADGNGDLTVSDGVNVLRAAAGLSSVCTDALCDVDDSGSITVTDGVNVLRAAAGLSATLACAAVDPKGQQALDAFGMSDGVTGILTIGLGAIPQGDARLIGSAGSGTSCPDGGTATPTAGAPGVVYEGCRNGEVTCSGTGVLVQGTYKPSLTCTDHRTNETFDLDANLAIASRRVTGNATGTQGDSTVFVVDYTRLNLDETPEGHPTGGGFTTSSTFFVGFFDHFQISFPGHNPDTGQDDPGFAKIVGFKGPIVFVFDLNLTNGKLRTR